VSIPCVEHDGHGPVPANRTSISEYEPSVLDEIILLESRAWGGRNENNI
jgi:hypothetical protein